MLQEVNDSHTKVNNIDGLRLLKAFFWGEGGIHTTRPQSLESSSVPITPWLSPKSYYSDKNTEWANLNAEQFRSETIKGSYNWLCFLQHWSGKKNAHVKFTETILTSQSKRGCYSHEHAALWTVGWNLDAILPAGLWSAVHCWDTGNPLSALYDPYSGCAHLHYFLPALVMQNLPTTSMHREQQYGSLFHKEREALTPQNTSRTYKIHLEIFRAQS